MSLSKLITVSPDLDTENEKEPGSFLTFVAWLLNVYLQLLAVPVQVSYKRVPYEKEVCIVRNMRN